MQFVMEEHMSKWILLIALAPAAAWACPKFFQPFNVPNTAFEKTNITFTENEFGPQIDGLKFKTNGKEAVGIFYGGRKKTWCAVLKDKKEGTSLDCGFLSMNKAGEVGSGNMIWVHDTKSKSAKPHAFAVHTDPSTITIYSLDPKKTVNKKDPMAAVDTTKPEIVLKGWVEVSGSEATAKMDVTVWDVTANKSLGKATHAVQGTWHEASAQISRPQIREAGPPPPIKPLTAFNLVGSHYHGPARCGFGEIAKYEAPADEGKDRIPAKSN